MESNYGDRLKLVRKYLGINQSELADFINLSQSQIPRYESMKKFTPKILMNLRKLKDKGINPKYFYVDDAPMLIQSVPEEPTNKDDKEYWKAKYEGLKQELDQLREKFA